jgi:integrase
MKKEVLQMIKLIEIKTGSAFWEIDGVILRFQRKKSIGDALTEQLIREYRELLLKEEYKEHPTKICEIDSILGDAILLRIGIEVYFEAFIKMFAYYTERYVKAWGKSDKKLVSNRTSMFPAFVYMFKNQLVDKLDSPIAILKNIPCDNQYFFDIYEEKFSAFWIEQAKNNVQERETLDDIRMRIGALMTTASLAQLPKVMIMEYLEYMANKFTMERKLITIQSYCRSLLGSKLMMSRDRFDPDFVRLVDVVVKKEYQHQCKKFIEDNPRQLEVKSDQWILYYKHGPSLYKNTMDFSKIQSKSLRLEIKYFMKYRYYYISAKKDSIIHTLSEAANLLVERNPSLHFFADVDDVDVRALYMVMERSFGQEVGGKSVSGIMRVFSVMSLLIDFLMSDRREVEMRSPIPQRNPFKQYKFHNVKDYKVRTLIIPESVAEGVDDHLHELEDIYALLYRIFSNTGMRMKEVLFLEMNCLEASPYDGLVQIKYKPYKTLKTRRKQGVSDYHRVLIFQSLADEIKVQIEERAMLRQTLGVPYIFVNQKPNHRPGMINMGYYVQLINKLIQQHNLCDESGEIWHFTSKQQRKTLAVTLIENGGSVDELAYWLGHLSRSSASGYYAEVRQMKLASLNTEFYRKKFDLLISKEQLADYSEEERRLLYMDFRLEQRRVEFGFCLKKFADGGCTYRNSLINCVNCKNLCTGKAYLSYWQELLKEQTQLVEALILSYNQANILNYEKFKEYNQAVFIKNCYENTIKAIVEGDSE